jgi:hypothetical protein
MKIKLIIILLLITNLTWANENKVAKVITLRGHAIAKTKDLAPIEIVESQDLAEGATIATGDKSFVKLIFIDKSLINIGPNSEMKISSFSKNEAGVISLLKGQIRSKVSKDYMNNSEKDKSKLYIHTQTSALGVRGTDFQVNFNPENLNTSLITFEGKVAFSHVDSGERTEHFDQRDFEKIVSSEKAVMVTEGQISAVNLNVAGRAMIPTLLGASQLNALLKNETGIVEKSDDKETREKQYRNPIPPGVSGETFSNISSENKNSSSESIKEASGFINPKTGEYKLPAGSIVDLNTVNIVPPPTNAVYDPNSKTFVVPETYGKIDKVTGEYISPQGLKLSENGKFVIVDSKEFAKSQSITKEGSSRTPASEQVITLVLPKVYDANPEMISFANQFATSPVSPPPTLTDSLKSIAEDRITTTEAARDIESSSGSGATSRPVTFDITIE